MRVALVTHSVVRNDGQGRMNYELARHCLRSGVGVHLVADRVAPDLLELGAEWTPVHPRVDRPVLFKIVGFVRGADRVVASLGDVDVVVGNGRSLSCQHDVNIANFVHAAYQTHGLPLETGRGPVRNAYQRVFTALNVRWEREAFSAAEVVVAISDRVRSELIAVGVPASKVRTIVYGVDTDEFRPASTPAERDRATLGLPTGPGPLAIFAGDIRTARKNLGTVLEAMWAVPALQLAVVGETAGSPFPAVAERLGLAGRVHFLGFRHDMAEVMRACDLFVFPTRYEPFGLVILEALASGLPVVTSAVAGAAELLTPQCGVAVDDPEDAAVLARAVGDLVGNPAGLAAASAEAREVAEGHGWAAMGDRYLELFERIAGSRVTAAPSTTSFAA